MRRNTKNTFAKKKNKKIKNKKIKKKTVNRMISQKRLPALWGWPYKSREWHKIDTNHHFVY